LCVCVCVVFQHGIDAGGIGARASCAIGLLHGMHRGNGRRLISIASWLRHGQEL
jgi:hypothetical protein